MNGLTQSVIAKQPRTAFIKDPEGNGFIVNKEVFEARGKNHISRLRDNRGKPPGTMKKPLSRRNRA